MHVLSDKVLDWVISSVGGSCSIESVENLVGGMSSLVYRIGLSDGQQITHVVLRLFNNKEWVAAEPDLAKHEAASLLRAAMAAVNTPMLIHYDETGSQCGGTPAVLMSELKGVVVLNPSNTAQWLTGMAEALVKIHAMSADDFPWEYYTYSDIATLKVPPWTRVPELWSKAIEMVQSQKTDYRSCFIHRDYHPTNILWEDNINTNTVSGVVDWVNACRGPAGIDVGHCRVNLAMLYGTKTANAFLEAYMHHAGSAFCYDSYWDLLSLVNMMEGTPAVYPGWTALGVTGLTDEMMIERLDQFLQSLL